MPPRTINLVWNPKKVEARQLDLNLLIENGVDDWESSSTLFREAPGEFLPWDPADSRGHLA